MQSRAITIKESQSGDAEALTDVTAIYEDSDDVLLRICGAQLNKMMVLRKETLKTKQGSKNIDRIGSTGRNFFRLVKTICKVL